MKLNVWSGCHKAGSSYFSLLKKQFQTLTEGKMCWAWFRVLGDLGTYQRLQREAVLLWTIITSRLITCIFGWIISTRGSIGWGRSGLTKQVKVTTMWFKFLLLWKVPKINKLGGRNAYFDAWLLGLVALGKWKDKTCKRHVVIQTYLARDG